ncbi:MAG: Holliday junction branch migration protein RuvA [Planctomycetes bacterium]|nr:Holliday junction branch migration protein RuvA [Planctomycetota bacterium]
MYDFIEGRLSERRPTHLVLEAGGIGYDLAVPLGADFPVREGRVRAWTHLIVREDAHLLFGFPERERRELFRLLLEVRGVGPAVALAVLSSLPGDELLRAIAAQDSAPFLRVKGIGKKTAEQILLDLRDKAPRMLAEVERGTLVPRAGAPTRRLEDAVRALISIGYGDKEARKSVERAAAKVQGDDLELLVRTALQE